LDSARVCRKLWLNWWMNYESKAHDMNIARSYFKTRAAVLLTSFAIVLLLASCVTPVNGWLSTIDTTHSLAGKIWSSHDKRWISEAELNTALVSRKFILLGETHDNPDHHRLQMTMLKTLHNAQRRPAIAMEQFDIENQAAIDKALQGINTTADTIADAGKLNRKGWQWEHYRPIVDWAVSKRLPLRAANLSRVDARRVFSEGVKASPVKFADAFFATTWNDARAAALKQELVAGHCGQLPDAMAPGMANVQRVRDAIMADAMLAYQPSGAVLIAGRGHVRRDRGVPLYLQHVVLAPAPTAVSAKEIAVVALMEIETGKILPEDYIDTIANEAVPFDYVWFTPRAARKDPCEGMSLSGLQATSTQK
jgi:uncharacterized iron-regulated protein